MKIILIPTVIFFCYLKLNFNSSNFIKHSNTDTGCYKIYKIDSINNFYLIYSRKNSRIYKIVSRKESLAKGEIIKVNGCYPFVLKSIIYKPENKASTLQLSQASCFNVSATTTVCLEGDSIRDLYSGANIKGKHLTRR